MTEKRFTKIKKVVSQRQKSLTLVLDNIHDPHNAAAIFRSADAVGIGRLFLVYNTNVFPRIGRTTSGGAVKWIETYEYDNIPDCFADLRKEDFKIYSTYILEDKQNLSLYEMDFTGKTAIVIGNEKDGVSPEAKELSDANFLIPMNGMIQSLNVSVAAAVCLFEAMRQRQAKGMYENSEYSQKEIQALEEFYINK